MKKILFVCLGNICRSPAAEGVFLFILKEKKLSEFFHVDSAGTSGLHSGQWPDERMIKAAKKRNVILPSRSRQISERDLDEFDYIFCMDQSNFKNVFRLSNAKENAHKIKLFAEFRVKMDYVEVPDPYYGTSEDFELVLDIVHDASIGFLKFLE